MSVPHLDTPCVRVVVIDDTPQLRLLLRKGLERLGPFTVVGEAGDGMRGVAEVRRHQPDLVLLDLAMPLMDGLEALPLVCDAAPQSKVVVLSAFDSGLMSRAAMERGATAYLQKGVAMTDMVRTLSDIAGVTPHLPRRGDRPVEVPGDAPLGDELPAGPVAELARIASGLAVAAHELRGPAAILYSVAELLSGEFWSMPREEVEQLLDTIRRQAVQLERLTTDLAAVTHAESGALRIDPTQLEVLPQLRAAAAVPAREVEMLVTCPVGLTAWADPVRVQQMVGNLVTNAVKYGRSPVRLVAQRVGGVVEIRVLDAGPGVPDELRPRLFERFARADGRRAGGTGLGLFVVRTLAEAHGGRAWYEDGDNGPAFCIALPAEPPVPEVTDQGP